MQIDRSSLCCFTMIALGPGPSQELEAGLGNSWREGHMCWFEVCASLQHLCSLLFVLQKYGKKSWRFIRYWVLARSNTAEWLSFDVTAVVCQWMSHRNEDHGVLPHPYFS